MKQPYSLRVDKELRERIKIKAKEEKRSVTNLIEFVMDGYCDKKTIQ